MGTKNPRVSQTRKKSKQTTGETARVTVQRKTERTTEGDKRDHKDTVGQEGDLPIGLSLSARKHKAVKKLPKAHPKAEGSEEPRRT